MILALYGAGARGREVKFIADLDGSFSEVIFVDDFRTEDLMGCKVYSFHDFKKKFTPDDVRFMITMGEPRFHKEGYEKFKQAGYTGAILRHPSADISPDAEIGEASVIFQNVCVGSLVKIGVNFSAAPNCTIGHDSVIGNSTRIGANSFVGGHVVIGDDVFIGSGTMLKDRIHIGNDSVVSMGAIVFNDVPEKVTVMGNPARVVSEDRSSFLYKTSVKLEKESQLQRDVAEKYWDVFSKCFSDIDFNPVSFRFNDDGWDSLMQMNLITQLEEAFDIPLKGRDVMRVNSYETGLQLIRKKLNEKER